MRNFNFKSFPENYRYSHFDTSHWEQEMVCPQCGLTTSNSYGYSVAIDPNPQEPLGPIPINPDGTSVITHKKPLTRPHDSVLVVSKCHTCKAYSIWLETYDDEILLYPTTSVGVGAPSEDMPTDIKDVYLEAASIFDRSPRASAALLRLATQLLVDSLVDGNKKLNDKIGVLVSNGLNARIQKALDSLRVIGNNAVHPGEISLNDDKDTALSLFQLVNYIVEQTITQPNKIDSIFDMLPQGAKDAVKRRDKNQ